MKSQNIYAAVFATATLLMSHNAGAQNNSNLLAANETAKNSYPSHYLPWHPIMEKDIVSKKRIWENINLKAEENNPTSVFGLFNSKMPLIDVLVQGVNEGKIIAYSTVDDRFTHALTKEEFAKDLGKMTSKNTTITRYTIKEDSLVTNTGETTVRIIGLAPVASTTASDGTAKEQMLFWLFYPDCRTYLAANPIIGADGWYDIFEGQTFSAKVEKVHDSKWNGFPKKQ